jgi:hypothetical protein
MARHEVRVYDDDDILVKVLKPTYIDVERAIEQYDAYLAKHPNANVYLVEVVHIECPLLWNKRMQRDPKPEETA